MGYYNQTVATQAAQAAKAVSGTLFGVGKWSSDYFFMPVQWGKAATITYKLDYTLTPEARVAAQDALKLWSDVANIKFVEQWSGAMTIGMTDLYGISGGFGLAIPVNGHIYGAAVVLDSKSYTPEQFARGDYGYQVMQHEIGHALGLKHPGYYPGPGREFPGPYLPNYGLSDHQHTSIMSYNYPTDFWEKGGYPVTPMLYDIAAIQSLYGANTKFNAGDTTYDLSKLSFASTRWDAGGNDTLVSNSSAFGSSRIDLREGESNYSTSGGYNFSWNAFGSNIENAIGGAGKDTIYGNPLNNRLEGKGGVDTISGAEGNDTIIGGTGADRLTGGTGKDVFVFTSLADSVGANTDRILDFTKGEDKIDLSVLDFTGIAAGDGADTVLGFNVVGSLTVIESAAHDFRIELQGSLSLADSDFIF